MRNLYVVTHPEATHHVDRVVGGWYDSDLTAAGRGAADLIAQSLLATIAEGAEVEVISSDLTRASRTADVIGDRLQVQVQLDPRLREKSYGEADGRPQEWLDQRFVPPSATGERMRHGEGLVHAETRADIAERVYASMAAILTGGSEDQVIVTHGFALTFVVASWIRMPIASLGHVSFPVAAGSITYLREDDLFHNRQVVALGDTRHLSRRGAVN